MSSQTLVARQPVVVFFLFVATAIGAVHCGAGVASVPDDITSQPDGSAMPMVGQPPASLATPVKHRAAPAACATTRAPGISSTPNPGAPVPGGCANDAECTKGKNGRCSRPPGNGAGNVCTYDECFVDNDCPTGNLCNCDTTGSSGPRAPNVCLQSNCRVDADCGQGGFCSPSFDTTCGPYDGVKGWFCHTTADECTNDDQCPAGRNGSAGGGYCAWQPALGKWACGTAFCTG